MSFRHIKGWTKPCPECDMDNPPHEGHINPKDKLTLRYICDNCHQKYERNEIINQVTVQPLKLFRRTKVHE